MNPTISAAFEVLNRLVATPSRKEKEKILAEVYGLKDARSDLVDRMLGFSLDPLNYLGAVMESPAPASGWEGADLPTLSKFLVDPTDGKYLSYNVRMAILERACSTNNADWNRWMPRIISKAVDVGVGAKTLEKFSPGTGRQSFAAGEADVLDTEDQESIQSLGNLFGDRYLIEPRLSFPRAFLIALDVDEDAGMVLLERGAPVPACGSLEEVASRLQVRDIVIEGYLEMSPETNEDGTIVPWHHRRPVRFHAYDAIPWHFFKTRGQEGTCPPYAERRQSLTWAEHALGRADLMGLHKAELFNSKGLTQHIANCALPNSVGSMLRQLDGQYPFSADGAEWVKIRALKRV
jgi:hypothetical protein